MSWSSNEKRRAYRLKNRDRILAQSRAWTAQNRLAINAASLKRYHAKYVKHARQQWQMKAIGALGGVCDLCGCGDAWSLTIDHIHGDGVEKRRRGEDSSYTFYRAVATGRADISGLRLLCFNCHLPQGFRKFSPIEAMRTLYCRETL